MISQNRWIETARHQARCEVPPLPWARRKTLRPVLVLRAVTPSRRQAR